MTEQLAPNLHRIEIPLKGNPLRSLNSYVVTSDQRNLLIDTGFNMPECLSALQAGIAELGLDMSRTDILATHMHSDHLGLVTEVASPMSQIYMGRVDYGIFEAAMTQGDAYWEPAKTRYLSEGYPLDAFEATWVANPGRKFAPSGLFTAQRLDAGDSLHCGDYHFTVLVTPGHTPGHLCLYDERHQLLIAGDAILFDITPNITWWPQLQDSLQSYLDSLEQLAQLAVTTCLTGHRRNAGQLSQRARALQQHHQERLADVLAIVKAHPGISGYDIAANMQWSIRASSWEQFPPGQRWFAVGEAIAHIDHLVQTQRLQRVVSTGIFTYHLE